MGKTRAIQVLEQSGHPFAAHEYETGDFDGSYGQAVAAAIGAPADRVFKTLVAVVDGEAAVAIVPVAGQLSLKNLARAAGGKKAQMADPKLAERLTGYVVGGISPFGQTRRLEVFVDESAARHDTIFVSGGRRGIQLEINPDILTSLLGAHPALLTS